MPVPRFQLILLGGFTSTDQVPQRFVDCIRYPDGRKFARSIASRQFLGIASIRLDSIPRLGRYQAWCDHFAGHPELCQLPVEYVTSGTSLVKGL